MSEAGSAIALVRGIPVVLAPARMNSGNTGPLLAALVQAADLGHATFVADLSRTESCDTGALSVLMRAHQRAVAEGGELRLAVTAPAVLKTLSVTGLDRVMRRFASVADAVAELPAIRILPEWLARPASRSGAPALRSRQPAR